MGYYLGLDVGTNSVGYAVTDEQYRLRKFHGEPMWGSHVFEKQNRLRIAARFRTARRRLNRRQQRVQLVQEIFAREIAKVDPRFFIPSAAEQAASRRCGCKGSESVIQ
jgi:CRISPR-associated endonuclease Csn1